MTRILTLHEKLGVIEHFTGGTGPIAVQAQSCAVGLSREFDRHMMEVEWQTARLHDAWRQLVAEVGDEAIATATDNLRVNLGHVGPAAPAYVIQLVTVRP